MSKSRRRLEAFVGVVAQPSWLDAWLALAIAYGVILRAHYSSYEGLAGVWARWSLSIMLALYGATVAMTVLVLAGRGLRVLAGLLRGADEEPW